MSGDLYRVRVEFTDVVGIEGEKLSDPMPLNQAAHKVVSLANEYAEGGFILEQTSVVSDEEVCILVRDRREALYCEITIVPAA